MILMKSHELFELKEICEAVIERSDELPKSAIEALNHLEGPLARDLLARIAWSVWHERTGRGDPVTVTGVPWISRDGLKLPFAPHVIRAANARWVLRVEIAEGVRCSISLTGAPVTLPSPTEALIHYLLHPYVPAAPSAPTEEAPHEQP